MNNKQPYLSIVVTARNDNYGGDFNTRLQNSVHWLSLFLELYKVPSELIIVDYNPVKEHVPLMEMLQWPQGRKHLTIKLLHIPNAVHEALVHPEVRKTVPLFEFNAKNMAIRRAKGEYILSTNADIIFHPSLIKFISYGIPSKGNYYRTDRFDFKKVEHYDFSHPSQTLKEIEKQVYRIMIKGYGYHLKGNGVNFFEEQWLRLKNAYRLFYDINLVKIEPLAKKWRMNITYDAFAQRFHTHCSGDFMLMHRQHWFDLRGYPENTYISTHCDAIFTVMAGMAGLKERVLPFPVYHQDHERRYKADFDEHAYSKEISDMFERFLNDSREMDRMRKPKIVNPAEWGHQGYDFKETVF